MLIISQHENLLKIFILIKNSKQCENIFVQEREEMFEKFQIFGV